MAKETGMNPVEFHTHQAQAQRPEKERIREISRHQRVGDNTALLFAAIQLTHEPIIEELRRFGLLCF
jgi:hypothetical protein